MTIIIIMFLWEKFAFLRALTIQKSSESPDELLFVFLRALESVSGDKCPSWSPRSHVMLSRAGQGGQRSPGPGAGPSPGAHRVCLLASYFESALDLFAAQTVASDSQREANNTRHLMSSISSESKHNTRGKKAAHTK